MCTHTLTQCVCGQKDDRNCWNAKRKTKLINARAAVKSPNSIAKTRKQASKTKGKKRVNKKKITSNDNSNNKLCWCFRVTKRFVSMMFSLLLCVPNQCTIRIYAHRVHTVCRAQYARTKHISFICSILLFVLYARLCVCDTFPHMVSFWPRYIISVLTPGLSFSLSPSTRVELVLIIIIVPTTVHHVQIISTAVNSVLPPHRYLDKEREGLLLNFVVVVIVVIMIKPFPYCTRVKLTKSVSNRNQRFFCFSTNSHGLLLLTIRDIVRHIMSFECSSYCC